MPCGGRKGDTDAENADITLKNKNWGKEDASWADTAQDRAQDRAQDETQDKSTMILDFCVKPRTKQEIMDHLGFSSRRQFNERYMKPLLEAGKLVMTIPDKPSSKNQKYVAKKKNGSLSGFPNPG